ncbi:MAG: amino acid ABC transporter substrate-binding protein [Sulfuritalea sp.]|nr:amino acid ABC transporter substrate-binding protein [Sulfuritalea sp.]MCF8184077.1 amino acid ABC transporter substrate-binding protein [Polynucleobacter sp.]
MNTKIWWRRSLILFSALAFLPAAHGQSFDKPTLQKIRDYGAIYIGHREGAAPFAYYAEDLPVGYSLDICHRIVDAIKAELGDPALKVVQVPVTESSGLLMLRTGVIDLECGATANTKIRQQTVAFGVTTYVSGIKAVVRKDSGIQRIADLNGKKVVTTAGTTTERIVRRVLAVRQATAQLRHARNHSESLAMVNSRQVDAFVLDDIPLVEMISSFPDADKLKLLEENFGLEPYGIALRKDDPLFKKLVDGALIGMMNSGEMEKLYNKWFMSSIPPRQINLRIPMSEMLRELMRKPTDTGI